MPYYTFEAEVQGVVDGCVKAKTKTEAKDLAIDEVRAGGDDIISIEVTQTTKKAAEKYGYKIQEDI